MRVGIVDLGGNTATLLVAETGREGGLDRALTVRVPLGLGAEIERTGRISKSSLTAVESTISRLVARARKAGCVEVEVLVTSPGRQSDNGKSLERRLERSAPHHVRIVTAEEEARLAYAGAVAFVPDAKGTIAVCDVGGGSTEIAVGTDGAPSWCRSLDIGSLRLTRRCLPRHSVRNRHVAAARDVVRAALETAGIAHRPDVGLASGGTARALRKLVGQSLGRAELDEALRLLQRTAPGKLARRFDLAPWRAEVLLGGAVILRELVEVLDTPLDVAAGGLREGAALRLLESTTLAAA